MTTRLLPWVMVNRVKAHGRAEECSGTQQSVVTLHAIASKMCRSDSAYKVKVDGWPAW